jgi:hypothetical protein
MKNTLLLLLFCIPILGFAQCTPPNGCENGKGTYAYSKDQRYEGEWLNGKHHGVGTLYYNSVQRYEGEWLNGEHHGVGTYTYPKEQRYEGEWLNGEKHGEGTYYYNYSERNGPKKYVGKWENNKKNGIGSEFYNNGRIWKGKWTEGEQDSGYFNDENYYNPNDIKGGQISSTINLMELMPDHYYISIDFNGLKKDFTFDTGATSLVISSDLLLDLKKHGMKIRDLKIEGGTASIASGDKVSTKSYIIDNIRIGNYLLNNVVVDVGSKGTSSLCGIGLFNKFSNVEWDMKAETLKLYK